MNEILFSLRCHLTPEDRLEFQRHALTHTKAGKQSLQGLRILLPGTFVCFLAGYIFDGASPDSILFMVLSLIIVSLIWIPLSKKFTLYSFKKSLESGTLEDLCDPVSTLEFTKEALFDKGENTELCIRYPALQLFLVSDKAFYLFFRTNVAVLLPYHCFESQAQIDALFGFLTTVIPPERIKRV